MLSLVYDRVSTASVLDKKARSRLCRSGGIKLSEVECLEDLEDKCGKKAVDQLFVFTMSTMAFS